MAGSPVELFDRFHVAIYRYLARMSGRRDVAEDLTQDVFVRVLRRGSPPDVSGGDRAWLFTIARNLLIDWQRRAARNPVQPAPREFMGLADGGMAAHPRHDLVLAVREALHNLPDADREALVLRVVSGLGHEEIASLTGTTAASVRSRIFRARSALRAALAAPASRRTTGGQVSSSDGAAVRRMRGVP